MNGAKLQWFGVMRVLKRGFPLSLLLYNIYIYDGNGGGIGESLAWALNLRSVGVGLLMYVDHFVLVEDSGIELQKLWRWFKRI